MRRLIGCLFLALMEAWAQSPYSKSDYYALIDAEAANPTYGNYFNAAFAYNDWMTKTSCEKYKGSICWTSRCAGWHFVNEYCCCGIQLNRLPFLLEKHDLVAAGAEPDEIAKQEAAA
jgi:hypothetical protein